MKIYVVTSGEYSDYGINAMFSTMELAESFMKLFSKKADFNDIEIWDLDDETRLSLIKSGRKPYDVSIERDGTVLSVIHADYPNSIDNYCIINYYFRSEYDMVTRTFGPRDIMELECTAIDETHAIKIANEIRTQILALNQWGIDKK